MIATSLHVILTTTSLHVMITATSLHFIIKTPLHLLLSGCRAITHVENLCVNTNTCVCWSKGGKSSLKLARGSENWFQPWRNNVLTTPGVVHLSTHSLPAVRPCPSSNSRSTDLDYLSTWHEWQSQSALWTVTVEWLLVKLVSCVSVSL